MADGMAPDARLVVVVPKLQTQPGDAVSVGYSTSHLAALEFLKLWAAGGALAGPRQPMAVNVSLGMNAGAHDGTSLLEATFDASTTMGQAPGLVIVKSAGNERGFGGHARVQAFNGQQPVQWESDARFRFQDYFEVWYSGLDEIQFSLVDPAGNATPVVSVANATVDHVLGGNFCKLRLEPRCKDNGDNRLTITILPESTPIQPGLWTLNVIGINARSRDRLVDIWVERDDGARAVRFRPEEMETTLSIPGTAQTVITVAACTAATPLQLTPESSFGPTRRSDPKPDIAAPGAGIVAAKANDIDKRAVIPMSGTSMAAPHVTGALALVLSWREKQAGRPQHNARQLMQAVNQTAKFGNGLHNPGVGYGLLDAEALFNLLK